MTEKGMRVVRKKNKRHTSCYNLGKFYQVRPHASPLSSSFTIPKKKETKNIAFS